ncbi:MAG TPA: ABC transporter permease [Gemmatimonadaceae bacterium]|nr:ABC transporter permease [Gemmatimonadaceae bacterium]
MWPLPGIPRAFRLAIRRRASTDLEDEFSFHLDMRANELIARGWNPEAARAEARRQFGDVDDARNFCRRTDERLETRTMRMELLTELRQDAGYAVRTLRRAPGFTLVAALTLALGIGANTAIFSVVRGILLRPLPFQDPDGLVMVAASYSGSKPAPLSPANAYDWREQSQSFSSMAVLDGHSAVLTGDGEPERLRGFDVSGDFFSLLGVRAVRGRTAFTAEESAWKGPKSVLMAESVWRSRYGADSSLVGRLITLDNERYQVVGIVPSESAWPTGAVLWFPFAYDPATLAQSRGAVYLNAVARLMPGVSLERATADLAGIAKRLEKQYPDQNTGLSAVVVPMRKWITGDLRLPLLVLLGGVGFVLLIACANVANLLLVRGVGRESELAVRTALGAGRGRLVRQLVTESVVLSLLGGATGLALAVIGTTLLVKAAPQNIPRLGSIHVDGLVLFFTLAIALLTGLVFGLIPARQLVQPDIAQTLREGGRGLGARSSSRRARQTLVVAEVALSVMLLAGAGLLIRSFNRLMSVDPGFRTDHSISFATSLPDVKYASPELQAAFLASLMERIHALPGVQSAGAGFGMPLTPFRFGFSFTIVGRPPLKPADRPSAEVRVATPDYFPTMGIPIVKGRGFTAADRAGGARVLLVTETAAKQFFGGEDPIGKHVIFGYRRGTQPLEGDIVGVVGDVKQSSLAATTLPQFWAPYDQWPMSSFNVVMHTTRDPQAVVADARRAMHELDPNLALAQVKTLDSVLTDSVAQPRFYMVLLTAFGAVAIALSAIGIYGVIAYLVGQRSREIGIRIALGASSRNVVGIVVREGAVMVALGLGVGLAGALALTQLMGALLFGIKATDPATYLAVTVVLATVAFAASCIPAWRAAHVDPALAMRAE